MGPASVFEVKALLVMNVSAIVDKPASVAVAVAETTETRTVFEIRVHSEDLGRIIGKEGRTARALRTLLDAISIKYTHRFMVNIIETDREPES